MNSDEIVEIYEVDRFSLNGEWYSEIHLSITHINFDKNGNRRNNFEAEQVIEIFIAKNTKLHLTLKKEKSTFV